MLLLLASISSAFAQDVLINEVLYDPAGADGGAEWVELCNPTAADVDVAGWVIETAGSSWGESFTIESGTVPAGGYLRIGGDSSTHPGELSPNIQNGGSSTDGVRLVNAGAIVVDTLLFDDPNTNALEDDSGTAGVGFAPDVSEDHSLGRWPNCTDTDDSGVDFADFSVPTPDAENTVEDEPVDTGDPPGECEDRVEGVVINELMANPSGSDDDAEWIELYHAGSDPADLTGWGVQSGTQDFGGTDVFDGSPVMQPGDYLVVGGANVPGVDLVIDFSLGNATSSLDGVRLVDCAESPVDTVIYGEQEVGDTGVPVDDPWVDDSGEVATSFAPKPAEGASVGRAPDGADTDQSGDDFIRLDFATPGASNTDIPPCEGQDDVRINEFLADPDGTDDGAEWVELVNTGSEAVDLTEWRLQWGTSSFGSEYVFEESVSIPAGGYLLVGGELVSGADILADISLGNAGSNADGVRLLHCGGGPADTVIYGAVNEDEWKDDTGEETTSLAPKPQGGLSLARCQDGVDTDQSGSDWVVADVLSPGSANPECVPVVCIGGDLSIKVNEVFPNPEGTDSDYEWVELYNAGSAAVSVDGWMLEQGTSTFSEVYTFPGGVIVEPGEFVVIGGSSVPADHISGSLSLGNSSKAPDGVRIVDCEGAVQDTLLWGKSQQDIEDLELLDDAGGQSVGGMPDEGMTLGRLPDGVDSDDNAADLTSNLNPTFGAANEAGGGGGDEPGAGGGGTSKGCSKNSGDDGASKCAVVDPASGLAGVFVLAIAALRRRRESSSDA